MPAYRLGSNASAPPARYSPRWTRRDGGRRSGGHPASSGVGRKNRHHVAIDLALEGDDQIGKLGHLRPAPGLELGLAAVARRNVNFAFLAQKAHGKPLLALAAVSALQRHAQQFGG